MPTHVTFEFNLIGIPGMNVLSIGYSKKHHTWSFCGNLLYIDGSGKIEIKDDMQDIRYADLIYFNKILKEKNIKFPTKESLNMLKKQKENCR